MSPREEFSPHGGLVRRDAKQAAVCCFFLATAHFALFYPGWLARTSYGHHDKACLNFHTYTTTPHFVPSANQRRVQI